MYAHMPNLRQTTRRTRVPPHGSQQAAQPGVHIVYRVDGALWQQAARQRAMHLRAGARCGYIECGVQLVLTQRQASHRPPTALAGLNRQAGRPTW